MFVYKRAMNTTHSLSKTTSRRISILALLFSACAAAHAAFAADAPAKPLVLDLDKGSGAVTFDAIGKPSALKIHAKGDAPKGQLKVQDGKVTGAVSFKLDSLDTGINMRNEHMKKRYLETDKFPEAKLAITELVLPANYSAPDFSADKLPFKGTLSLHGVDKPVTGTAKASRSGDDLSIEAHFSLVIEDYAIKLPTFAGITMASEVNCGVEAKAPFKAQ
jgi:polyisoprenoid-binding protein YceI